MNRRSSNLIRITALAAFPVALLTAPTAEAAPVEPFLYEYRGDRAPEAADATDPTTSPTWTATTLGALTANSDFDATDGLSDAGYLRIESSRAGRPRYSYAGAAWNVSDAFTIEIRAKVVSVDPDGSADVALELIAGDEAGRFIFQLGQDQLQFRTQSINGTTLPGFDPTAYNVYRIIGEKEGGAWTHSVYINDELVIDGASPYGGADNSIRFGDSSTSYGGTSEIDYIRWNNEAAIPVPEPGSFALITMGPILLLSTRRKRA